jgi:hypothetical protein
MTEHAEHEGSTVKTWLIIVCLLLIVGFQGALSYFIVGDLGQPDWDLRPVMDVPGESPYAVYEFFPFPQHVKGDDADYPALDQKWGFPYAIYGTSQTNKGDDAQDSLLAPGWDKSMFPAPQQNAVGSR